MKIAFVDIDGTILDYSRGINFPSETCIDMFKRFKDQGNILIIATSRAQLPPGLNKDMFDGFVFSNGQYIEYRKEVLLNNAFTREQILLQQAIYKKYDAGSFFSGVKGQWMSSFRKELAIEHMVYFGLDPDKVDEMFLPFVIEEVESNAATAAFDNSNNMWLAKAELPQDWIIHAYDEESIRMDVHLPGVTKGSSCIFLCDHIGIKHEDSYAFGDGLNDIEMLELVGHGVAMGNANEAVKLSADYISASVEEDGLALAFKEIFNLT